MITLYFDEIVLLVLLGGLLAVDERAGWQSLLSQPVMGGALVGAILGDFLMGVTVGVILELVWLSVLPMRGVRRPDAVSGSIVGAGTACLVASHTGDPRFVFVASLGTVLGLVAGEVAGVLGRRLSQRREKTLGDMEVPADDRVLQRKLFFYFAYSVSYVFAVEVLLILVMLPLSVLLVDWITWTAGGRVVTGSQWWIHVVPALGAGALIQMYWHKQHIRYLALSAGIVLVLLWFS